MEKAREIKKRIRSVQNTRQITKTMEMVAAAKIKKAQEQIEAARPYALKMMDVLHSVARHVPEGEHPLLELHDPVERVIILVLTSNRGLCGAFNFNILERAEALYKEEVEQGSKAAFLVVGEKGLKYLRYRRYPLLGEGIDIGDRPSFEQAAQIARQLMKLYCEHKIDKVYVVFNHFKSVMEQYVTDYVVLPIQREEASEEPKAAVAEDEYIFEPTPREVLFKLLPTYIETLIYRTLMESSASEHGARRTAMKAATDNAVEMIGELTRTFNKARQWQITQEILEVSSGAEALRQSRT